MHTFSDSFFDVHVTKHPLDIIEFPDKYIIFILKMKEVSIYMFQKHFGKGKTFLDFTQGP